MKLLIELDDDIAKGIRGENDCKVEAREIVRSFQATISKAIVNGIPYEERPQGEWVIDGHHIRCNRCNEYICNTDREGNKIPDNFCPNCGADMKGGAA